MKERKMQRPKKSLGQNFLKDESISENIARAGSIDPSVGVIEIGPGHGALTKYLLRYHPKVTAIELDGSLIEELEDKFAYTTGFGVIHADALKSDLDAIAKERYGDKEYAVFGNIPYYLTSPLVMKVVDETMASAAVFMMQKEAADRICAAECSRDAGAITLSVQMRCSAEKLFDVPPSAFYPQPKVTSSVIILRRLAEPRIECIDTEATVTVIRAAFSQRRKQASNSIASVLGIDKTAAEAALIAAGAAGERAEKISMAQYGIIADTLISGGWHHAEKLSIN